MLSAIAFLYPAAASASFHLVHTQHPYLGCMLQRQFQWCRLSSVRLLSLHNCIKLARHKLQGRPWVFEICSMGNTQVDSMYLLRLKSLSTGASGLAEIEYIINQTNRLHRPKLCEVHMGLRVVNCASRRFASSDVFSASRLRTYE